MFGSYHCISPRKHTATARCIRRRYPGAAICYSGTNQAPWATARRGSDTEDFVEIVKRETKGRGADVIFDPVGGDIFDRSRRCIAFEGCLVVIGFAGGRADGRTGGRVAEAPTNHVLVKNYSVVGLHWGLYNTLMPGLIVEAHEELMRLYEGGRVKPLIYHAVPFAEIPAALDLIGSRATWGKLVARSIDAPS